MRRHLFFRYTIQVLPVKQLLELFTVSHYIILNLDSLARKFLLKLSKSNFFV
jgi:hypothetical protein